jgi:hypothetical protein
MRFPMLGVILTAALALGAAPAYAAPLLINVGQQDRHPTASLTGAETIYMATSPERASDGKFLEENITDLDLLTDAEIASGQWLYERQLDPGVYWLVATDYETYSEPMALEIPKPKQRYRVKVSHGFIASFEFIVTPLGEDLPYRVCWPRGKGRKCLRETVGGYDWNDAASDIVYLTASDVGLSERRRKTKLTWWANGTRVVSKTVRLRKG